MTQDEESELKKKTGPKSVLTNDILAFVLLELENDSKITLKTLVEKIKEEKQAETSISALDRALKSMEITWKSILKIPINWNSATTIAKRKDFITKVISLNMHREFIYIDECGFNLQMKKGKGRAEKGQPAILSLSPAGHRLTLIAAISKEGRK